jgi:subtilisin family serine protease
VRKEKLSIFGALALLVSLAVSQSTNSALAAEDGPYSDFIVIFEPEVSRTTSNKIILNSDGQLIRGYSKVFNGTLVSGPTTKMLALAKNPKVLSVEENLEVSIFAVQDPAPWGLDRIDQESLPLNSTFDDRNFQGANTISYIVDTGIDSTNTDFEGRVRSGYDAIQGVGSYSDCNGHGTHVAGIVGSKTFGVAKQTALVPVRVLNCDGEGSYSSVIAGLNWIAATHRPGDAAVVNMSLGGVTSSTLDEAVSNLFSKGITVVVAAGNDNDNACSYSPARAPEAITVGATGSMTSLDERASYSNFGSCLDIFAPGTSIPSTWLGAQTYNTISGTSMAAPHVAGLIARFIGQYPGLTPAQITRSIKSSSIKNQVSLAGTGSPNNLAYLYVEPDITNVVLGVTGSAKTVARGENVVISAVSNVDGKITFRANGKRIPGCISVKTVSLTATCQWKSSLMGSNQLSAQITPTEIASNEMATSSNYPISVGRRTGRR